MRVRFALVAIAMVAAATLAAPTVHAGPLPQRCTLTGTYVSGGAGQDGFSYALDGSGSCAGPAATVTIASRYGSGANPNASLPTCSTPGLGAADRPLLPTDREIALVDVTVTDAAGTRTALTRWELDGVAEYVGDTVLVYTITSGFTGRAVITAPPGSGPLCARTSSDEGSTPISIRMALDP